MKLVNLTAHSIAIWDGDEVVVEVGPSGLTARCAEDRRPGDPITVGGHEVAVASVGFGEVVGLPDPVPGVGYVVSRAVAEAVPGRADVFYPDIPVRDEQGRIVGCRALARAVPRKES
jgi:hypothetical protein